MVTMIPPTKGAEYIFYIGLISQADTKLLKAAPTIAAGDFKVSTDGSGFTNLDSLPDVDPDAGTAVKITLSADEMNGDNIVVTCIDAADAEWCDMLLNIQTAAQSLDTMDTNIDDIKEDTGTTLDALIKDVPTVAEFEARSILAADYVVVGDTIAGVTAVSNDVGITQAGADKVWGTAARALTDKVGFGLSTAAILAIWHQLTANIVTADTIGKLLKDDIDATVSSRSSHTAANVRAETCLTGDGADSIGKILFDLNARVTAARAGYLANIDNANLKTIADISSLNATIIGYLNNANLGTIADISTLTATEIAYLDAAITALPTKTQQDSSFNTVITDVGTIATKAEQDASFNALNNISAAEVNTQVDTALSDINLDHLAKIAVDTDLATTVHDDSVLGYLMATAGVAAYARTDDALQSIRDAVAAAAPQTHIATSESLITYGTVDSGTYADTITDNDVYWQISPVAVNALDLYLQFEIGTGRVPSSASFNGHFDALVTRWANVYAWNYLTSSWDQISNEDNRLSHATSDYDREYVLLPAHASVAGQIRIRIYTTSVTTGDDLYIDMLTVSSVEAAGAGLTAAAIRDAIYEGDITIHQDHNSFAFTVATRYLHRGQITAVTDQTHVQDSSLPAVADIFNNHVALFHEHALNTYCLRAIKDMDASGNITLYHAPACELDTDTYLFVLSQKQKVNILDEYALAQINAECDTALSEYDGPTKAEMDTSFNTVITDIDAIATKEEQDSSFNTVLTDVGAIATKTEQDTSFNTVITEIDANETKIDEIATKTEQDASFNTVIEDTAEIVNLPTKTQQDTSFNTVIVDTNELQTDWANGGRLDDLLDAKPTKTEQDASFNTVITDISTVDTVVDGIKAKTDNLPDDPADTSVIAGRFDTVDTSLNTVITDLDNPDQYKAVVSPLALEATLTAMKGATFAGATDSLEAIRNQGDAAWITGPGGDASEAKQDSIITYVDELETRLSAARAGYLDNLSAGALALASVCTEARLAELAAANLPSDIDHILADTGTDGVVVASGSKSGYALSPIGIDSILDEEVEGTTTFRQMLRIFMAALAGKSAGGGTVTITFQDVADSKNRIRATVDASGNRTAMALDGE